MGERPPHQELAFSGEHVLGRQEPERDGGGECSLCLEDMEAGGVDATSLPCGHFFHSACIKDVLEKAKGSTALLCPLYRAPLCTDRLLLSTASR